MIFFLDRRNDDVHITTKVIQAITKNYKNDKKIITFFFDRRNDNVHVTTKVIQTIAKNYKNDKKIISFFLIDEMMMFMSQQKWYKQLQKISKITKK